MCFNCSFCSYQSKKTSRHFKIEQISFKNLIFECKKTGLITLKVVDIISFLAQVIEKSIAPGHPQAYVDAIFRL